MKCVYAIPFDVLYNHSQVRISTQMTRLIAAKLQTKYKKPTSRGVKHVRKVICSFSENSPIAYHWVIYGLSVT